MRCPPRASPTGYLQQWFLRLYTLAYSRQRHCNLASTRLCFMQSCNVCVVGYFCPCQCRAYTRQCGRAAGCLAQVWHDLCMFVVSACMVCRQAVPENQRRTISVRGIVIAIRNRGIRTSFRLLNNITGGGNIERVFPLCAPAGPRRRGVPCAGMHAWPAVTAAAVADWGGVAGRAHWCLSRCTGLQASKRCHMRTRLAEAGMPCMHAMHACHADRHRPCKPMPFSLRSVSRTRRAAAGVRAARGARGRFCPTLQELRVVQKQRVKARRAKLYYLRDRKPSEFKV